MIDESKLAAELRDRHGVTTRERLRKIGLSDRQITGLVSSGRFVKHGRGVFATTGSPDTFEQRVAIACALTGGVAANLTAAQLWDYRKAPRDRDIHVLVHWARRVTPCAGVVVHRTTELPESDIVRRSDGIAVTSPPRTVFDLAGHVGTESLESIIEQGIDRRNFVMVTLWRTCHRLHRSARAGSVAFERVLRSRPAWRKPVRSDYELRLDRAMRARGFPELVREHRLVLPNGEVIHPDLGLPQDGFFVEVDHVSWHGGRTDSAYDKRRDRKVRVGGWHVERVPDLAIDNDLDDTVEDLWLLWHRHRGEFCTSGVQESPR